MINTPRFSFLRKLRGFLKVSCLGYSVLTPWFNQGVSLTIGW
jgi:hypothetical protein